MIDSGTAPRCPFVGLRSFREEDECFFFGREREIRVISSNVVMTPLTVLYGSSGVGKSSLLQAGVIPFLKKSSDTAVVYFNTWQNESFLSELNERCRGLSAQPTAGTRADADLDRIIIVPAAGSSSFSISSKSI